ncbi:probable serine/threonine-protein kinase PBL26 [Panicum hallii]|uniref:probable serine/threonine-protein kinase PBL26 n=1 Tax=Panicum hallii TaxID=206008 RepID=UPI000DF4CC94|nr:probable serine/threonine-protein kinase PBL26 [Panicum hallii]
MPVASSMMGSFGCCPSEYDRSGQATMKSDVYSFGVVLVQLISGRRAVDTSKPVTEQNVVTWVRELYALRSLGMIQILYDAVAVTEILVKRGHVKNRFQITINLVECFVRLNFYRY